MAKVDILCNDGSPLGVTCKDIFGESGRVGVGGAELALLTMAEAWSKEHEVVLYNNPKRQGESPFEQRKIHDFEAGADRDILIVFRSPNMRIVHAKGLRVWWSCDQYTVGDFANFSRFVNKIVTISPFHTYYFFKRYAIKNAISIDLPVRFQDYENLSVRKVENRIIFTSVPERGLGIVADLFPEIRKMVDASLVITSDYRLWGAGAGNGHYVQRFLGSEGVEYLGAVPRRRLVEEQLKAQIHLYPCLYDELFGIAVAESQYAGVLPITTNTGALETTNMGVLVRGFAQDSDVGKVLIEKTIEYLNNPDLENIQKFLAEKARKRFSIETIMKQWNEKVFKDI